MSAMDVDEMDIDIDLGVDEPNEYEMGTTLVVRCFRTQSILKAGHLLTVTRVKRWHRSHHSNLQLPKQHRVQ